MEKKHPTVLACDPSSTAWGWAVFQNHARIDSGCIKTKPEAKKRRIRQTDDFSRRVNEIAMALMEIIVEHKIEFILTEIPHGAQNYKGALMIGMVIGVLQTTSVWSGISMEEYSEADAKKALLGRISASKAEVIAAVEENYEDRLRGPKYMREAVADAMAIYNVAQMHSPTLKILLR
jgi:Holliday junction resolvasome RuvABC endonuclease subunit